MWKQSSAEVVFFFFFARLHCQRAALNNPGFGLQSVLDLEFSGYHMFGWTWFQKQGTQTQTRSIWKNPAKNKEVVHVEPTIMENPIGPLITQFGTGLSFLSQHLRTSQTTEHHVNTVFHPCSNCFGTILMIPVHPTWHARWNFSHVHGIYFPLERFKGGPCKTSKSPTTNPKNKARKTWNTTGQTLCQSHSKQANQISPLPVESVGNSSKLPISVRSVFTLRSFLAW